MSAFISTANSAVSRFDLEIRSSLHQTPKNPASDAPDARPTRVYALVNTTSDPLTQLATTYTADEIAFVKRILDYMFTTKNDRLCEGMVILPTQAIQLARASSGDANRRQSGNADSQQPQGGAVNSLSMTQAETMLQRLIQEGWLEKSRKGYCSLTPRALMELRGWLVSTYNDESGRQRIKFCDACKDIMTVVGNSSTSITKTEGLTFSNRASVVATTNARADSTTTVRATSSAFSRHSDAPSARRTGPGTVSSARELSRPVVDPTQVQADSRPRLLVLPTDVRMSLTKPARRVARTRAAKEARRVTKTRLAGRQRGERLDVKS